MTDLFEHSHWIYERSEDNRFRYVLGERGENPLVCIGVNPSTATPEQLDPTLRNVKSWAKRLKFDGWIMLNLYPLRATNPNDLPKEMDFARIASNAMHMSAIFERHETYSVWAAWGALIEKRSYLSYCVRRLVDIPQFNPQRIIHIGPLSVKGHPHHPLYLSHKSEVQDFDIQAYLKREQA
jgi:hypothetical protein